MCVQYAAGVEEPVSCHICDEERQYVNPKGQSWTTLESLQTSDTYKNEIIEEENGLLVLQQNQDLRSVKRHM